MMNDVATTGEERLRELLAGLRLRLEDLARWPETSPAMVDELHRAVDQVIVLSNLVDVHLPPDRGLPTDSTADRLG